MLVVVWPAIICHGVYNTMVFGLIRLGCSRRPLLTAARVVNALLRRNESDLKRARLLELESQLTQHCSFEARSFHVQIKGLVTGHGETCNTTVCSQVEVHRRPLTPD